MASVLCLLILLHANIVKMQFIFDVTAELPRIVYLHFGCDFKQPFLIFNPYFGKAVVFITPFHLNDTLCF